MSRLVDRLLRYGCRCGGSEIAEMPKLLAILRESEVLLCDEAAEIVEESPGSWGLSDYPVLMPPFGNLFAEAHFCDGTDAGALLLTASYPDDASPNVREVFRAVNPKWVVHGDLFAAFRACHSSTPAEYVAEFAYALDETGQSCGDTLTHQNPAFGSVEPGMRDENADWSHIHPFMLSIALANCKNVVLDRVQPVAPKLASAHEKKYKYPPIRYRLLLVGPMREVLRAEGASDQRGMKRALHICRGHFKTYTSEHKLFGRIEGRYWWQPSVRGSLDRGMVIKDYAIHKPQPLKPKEGAV